MSYWGRKTAHLAKIVLVLHKLVLHKLVLHKLVLLYCFLCSSLKTEQCTVL